MSSHTTTVRLQTQGDNDIVDLTPELTKAVAASGIQDGTATAFIPGSTAGITVTELEPGLVRDTAAALERLVPRGLPYAQSSAHAGASS